MGAMNTCFDYEMIEKSVNNLEQFSQDNKSLTKLSDVFDSWITDMTELDKTHDAISIYIDEIEDNVSKTKKCGEEYKDLCVAMNQGINIFKSAEGDISDRLKRFADVVEGTLGNSKVAGYLRDSRIINESTFTTSSEQFAGNASLEVQKFISNYAMYLDGTYPAKYDSAEDWYNERVQYYLEKGYSSYDAKDLALLEMAKWRTEQTGATVTSNAVSALADENYSTLNSDVSKEYTTLTEKYEKLGATEEQAKELATAESEWADSVNYAKENPGDSGARYVISDNYKTLEALKEKYGITDSTQQDTTTPDDPGGGDDPDTTDSNPDTGGDNGGDYPEDNDGSSSTQARVETPSPNPSPSDTPNKGETPTTDPTPEETPSDNTDTPSDNTGDNSNTGTDPETPSTGDDNNNTNTGNDSNNTKPDGGNNSNNNTGGNTGSGSNTNHGNTSRPSGNTGNNSGYYVPGNNNGGGTSSTPPTAPSAGENGNAATTTPSAPDSDAGIIDNSGEELDVISIDKGSSAKPSTSSNDGGSVIPAILGVGVAGAAGVAGVKYIKNKKEKDNEYEDDSINEDENSFSYIGDYQENTDTSNDSYNAMPTGEKYKAGNVNKLVLDDAPENIKIEESMNDTTNQKEELE